MPDIMLLLGHDWLRILIVYAVRTVILYHSTCFGSAVMDFSYLLLRESDTFH